MTNFTLRQSRHLNQAHIFHDNTSDTYLGASVSGIEGSHVSSLMLPLFMSSSFTWYHNPLATSFLQLLKKVDFCFQQGKYMKEWQVFYLGVTSMCDALAYKCDFEYQLYKILEAAVFLTGKETHSAYVAK